MTDSPLPITLSFCPSLTPFHPFPLLSAYFLPPTLSDHPLHFLSFPFHPLLARRASEIFKRVSAMEEKVGHYIDLCGFLLLLAIFCTILCLQADSQRSHQVLSAHDVLLPPVRGSCSPSRPFPSSPPLPLHPMLSAHNVCSAFCCLVCALASAHCVAPRMRFGTRHRMILSMVRHLVA